jgi:hypothetical protein
VTRGLPEVSGARLKRALSNLLNHAGISVEAFRELL